MIGRLKTWLAAAGALIVGGLFIYLKGKNNGEQGAQLKQQRKSLELQNEFDDIDRQSPDLDASIERLRRRNDDN